MSVCTFLLGAEDPEMGRIREVICSFGQTAIDAVVDGKRVNPRTAYTLPADWRAQHGIAPDADVVLVECGTALPHLPGPHETVVDHHHPSQATARLGPADFWQASALGQVSALVGHTPTDRDRVTAACDHSLPAAYRGECPGVSPDAVMAFRLGSLSSAPGADGNPEKVRAAVEAAREELRRAPRIQIGGQDIIDLRASPRPGGYCLPYLAGLEATMREGAAVLLSAGDAGDSREKWCLAGHCAPGTIEAFLHAWAPAHGLSGIYGVPARGFAGGYLPVPVPADGARLTGPDGRGRLEAWVRDAFAGRAQGVYVHTPAPPPYWVDTLSDGRVAVLYQHDLGGAHPWAIWPAGIPEVTVEYLLHRAAVV